MADGMHIPKLNNKNYAEWSYFMKEALVLKGWASAIDPDYSIPGDVIKSLKDSVVNVQPEQKVKADVAAAPVKAGEEEPESSAAAQKKEQSERIEQEMAIVRAVINERALALIRGTVSFNCSHLIGSGKVTAMEAWLNLESAFAAKLKACIAALNKQLQAAKLGKQSIGEFVGEIVRLGAEVKAAGGTITDHDLKDYILAGLPENYQSVVDVLSEQELTVTELQARLQLAEGRRRAANPRGQPAHTPAAGHAHAARGVRAGAGGPPQKKNNATYKAWLSTAVCRHCGGKGHLWKNCAKRLKEEANAGMGGIVLGNAYSALAH